ncbi:hypothetical protein A7K50_02915 [Dehalobacter sp. MCB1]|uniref:SpaA isopeptide-forming pilin-related protein n=1 Tax=Dehalobacter sp. MCB1 TaxID=1844756 RepID=UPI000E6C1B12|nr:SpaA isopeptide-forming pilin-related protein [Dehalobacter sp. MCB1]RJE47618.1 hypothetical protein A7K50_02915 [Dehalobacter sp. MCB1]
MLIKKTRFSKVLVLCLIFTLILSFSTAFGITLPAGHTCTYPDAAKTVTPDPAGATKGNITGPAMLTASGTIDVGADSEVEVIIEGTEAHIKVTKGAISQVAVKAAHSFRYWTFSPSMQVGDCVIVTTAGCFSNDSEKSTIGESALHGISHLVFGEGTVVEEKGSITISKDYAPVLVDETPVAIFQLFDEQKNAVKDAQNDDVTATINGKNSATMSNLTLGNYYLKEITSPSGYTLLLKVGSTTLIPDANGFYGPIAVDSSTAVVLDALNAKLGSVQIMKSYEGKPTDANEEATFQLFTESDGKLASAAKDINGNLAKVTITNASTTPSVINNLVIGKYYLKEIGPIGYDLSVTINGVGPKTANSDGLYEIDVNTRAAVEVSALNTKTEDTGTIQIYKYWRGEGTFRTNVVSDPPSATFKLCTHDSLGYHTVKTITVTGDGSFEKVTVPVGMYYLQEISTNKNGYELTSLEIDVNGDGIYDPVDPVDGYYPIKVEKDQGTTAAIPSVVIHATNTEEIGEISITKVYSGTVYDKDVKFNLKEKTATGYEDVVNPFYLGSGETTEPFVLPVGTYYLAEEIPSNYSFSVKQGDTVLEKVDNYYVIKVTKRTYTEQGDGQIPVVVNFTALNSYNPPPPPPPPGKVNIQINKAYTTDVTAINPTATFTLYTKAGETYTAINSVSIVGPLSETISNLDPGTYYLKESAVPTGFTFQNMSINNTVQTPDTQGYYVIDATATGTTVTVTATNAENPPASPPEKNESIKIKEELPKTGGNTAAYLLSGSILAAVGALLRRFQK